MFKYEFMQNAFLSGTIVAIMAGFIGVFVISRNMSFISHTLSHVGFSGAAFAVFLGISPIYGLILFTTSMSYIVGYLGDKSFRRESTVSVMLGIFLGLGLLFLSITPKSTSYVNSILFGSIVSITSEDVKLILILSTVVILLLLSFYRVLKFDSFDQIGAIANGINSKLVSIFFLTLLSIAVSVTVPIIGALLMFVLLTVPASSARFLSNSIAKMIVISIIFSILGVWLGLTLSYYTSLPVTFYIATIEGILYFISLNYYNYKNKRH
ncbi:metal ABC transporter permease [Gemelliphila palaticanis]|uniref:Metal ABC transporter permease n=1 Tax=Gemelliphila palaticanis TaxID=81950 RepID=A0ABX2SZG7_9BACL|nr:metal ABC transporter permease [Gemella palaticanis]MBF0715755.1 metal ABC transporter permease [Gemella palaticanis]NYS47685.1 metal ABC transporter permease [Gemella palaticanis]